MGLAVVSLATAIVMLARSFKRTSNQTRLAAVKRQIHAALFEIRLFNDDLRAIFRAQREMLRHNLTYLRLSLVPMLWMIVPLVLVIAQLQFHYGYAGLEVGQSGAAEGAGPRRRRAQRLGLAGRGARIADERDRAGNARCAGRNRSADAGGVVPRHARGDLAHRAAGRRRNSSFGCTMGARPSPRRSTCPTGGATVAGAARAGVRQQLLYPAEAPLPGDARGHLDQRRLSGTGHQVFGWSCTG